MRATHHLDAAGSPRTALAAVLGVLIAAGCGFIAEKGEEPSGTDNLPASGVGAFVKEDFFCNAQLVQPFVLPSESEGTRGEPSLLHDGGLDFRVWSERRVGTRGEILHDRLFVAEGTECRTFDASTVPDGVVLTPLGTWDGDHVGAPSVVLVDGLYRMWFEGGASAGIGYAESTDGLTWTRRDASGATGAAAGPVLVPDQIWEAGRVGSPSVLFEDGRYRLWYDGNTLDARSIGYAESSDGLTWTKRDAAGRSSAGGASDVAPVVIPDQRVWEFEQPGDPVGSVGQPHVLRLQTPLRVLYLLYYTGNLRGRLDESFDDIDSSIGIATSEDGLTWAKAPSTTEGEPVNGVNPTANEINPIVAENLPITLGPDIDGSFNNFSGFSIIDEAAPSVVYLPEKLTFFMLWHQIDRVNESIVRDLAPEDPDLGPHGFPGMTGVGLRLVGELASEPSHGEPPTAPAGALRASCFADPGDPGSLQVARGVGPLSRLHRRREGLRGRPDRRERIRPDHRAHGTGAREYDPASHRGERGAQGSRRPRAEDPRRSPVERVAPLGRAGTRGRRGGDAHLPAGGGLQPGSSRGIPPGLVRATRDRAAHPGESHRRELGVHGRRRRSWGAPNRLSRFGTVRPQPCMAGGDEPLPCRPRGPDLDVGAGFTPAQALPIERV